MTKLIPATLFVAFTACATAPKTASDREELSRQAASTLTAMTQKDPGLSRTINTSAGYAVFPDVGKGGLIVGGAHGRGILYEGGRQVGFVDFNQASLGAQIGAQSFSELIVFLRQSDVERVKYGQFSLGGNISGVILTAGAAGAADFKDGVAVFLVPHGGAMAELSLSGQKINYKAFGT